MQKEIFPASLDHLHKMLDFVHQFALKQGFEDSIASKIMLATEEAIVNVIRHGYLPSQSGYIEITCEESPLKPGMKLLIKDYGIPFNPVKNLEEKAPKIEKGESPSVGGYGIFIYVGLMDRVEYVRTEEGNLLFLTKYL